MLAADDQAETLNEAALELKVVLPIELERFFDESGYVDSLPTEVRTNARLRVRSEAIIEFTNTPVGLKTVSACTDRQRGKGLVKDLSRGGIGILYHEQIYPKEQLCIYFQGRVIHGVAVRCRRVGACCFETGCSVLSVQKCSTQRNS